MALTTRSASLIALLIVWKSMSLADKSNLTADKSISNRAQSVDASRSSSCVDRPLQVRVSHADVVLSGTVRSLEANHLLRHSQGEVATWRARVLVKRIIKGENIVDEIADIDVVDEIESKLVWISGFGDQRICKSKVHLMDTRIFMTKFVDNELHLNSSVAPVTLDIIDHADAIVHNKKYVTKPSELIVDPCRSIVCPYWGICEVNPETITPECRCSTKCTDVFAPVCGSDNVTYINDCYMRAASCSQRRRVAVSYLGSCHVRDPCTGKTCSYGARCVASLDGLVARCQCPDTCSSYGDSVGSTPVCGTDGVDYPNACELQKAACREMKDIGIKYEGKCDPCKNISCPQQVCQLDEQRRPVCRCGSHLCLQNENKPVCASDGRTYSSECVMRGEACRSRTNIRVLFQNSCASFPGRNACAQRRCNRPYEICMVHSTGGRAQCLCPADQVPCEPVMRPVCASDGQTYDNDCEMMQKACMSNQYLTMRSYGSCPKDGPCKNYRCENNAVCVVKNGQPSCVCPSCMSANEFQPVCGSDGITYSNECKLRTENCETKGNVTVKYHGTCTTCENKKCDFYSVCDDDGYGVAKCVCATHCPADRSPVCGSDGVTYSNQCELQVASCRKQQYIIIQSEGPCDACANVQCRHGALCENGRCVCPQRCPDLSVVADHTVSVCANDGVTYSSVCSMRLAACQLAKDLEVEHSGPCDDSFGSGSGGLPCDETNCRFGGVCKFDARGFEGCVCNYSCEAVRSDVCGSDGKIYSNECQLREESCKRQTEIFVEPLDNCGGIDEELCDGKPSLINPVNGVEYNCDDGHDSCPSGSYCHRTATAARCCREDRQVSGCRDSTHGCCQDGVTTAPGPNKTGCPSFCMCNSLGSLSKTCDPNTRQCTCKPGVGGVRCDRCEPGYWGLRTISTGASGCTPCGCSKLGSERDDCEQSTGRCSCRPGITGQKCTLCPNGKDLVASGNCEDQPIAPRSCADLQCLYGARCVMSSTRGTPECVCDSKICALDGSAEELTCGSDGMLYGSECQLKLVACRLQKNIGVANPEFCSKDPEKVMKPDKKTTPLSIHLIGDSCDNDQECEIEHSSCASGICVCDVNFEASYDGLSCKVKATTTPPFTRTQKAKPTTARASLTTISTPKPTLAPTKPVKTVKPTTRATTTERPTPSTPKPTLAPTKPVKTVKPTTRATTTERPTTTPSTPTTTPTKPPTTPTTPTTIKPTTVEPTTARIAAVTTVAKIPPPLTTVGASTETGVITIPEFNGNSFLEIPIKKTVSKTFNYEIWFLTNSLNGVLLYGRQTDSPQADFLSLNLVNGFLQLRYNLGSGIANITSATKLPLKTWHKVVISRTGRTGTLQVNDQSAVTGDSKGPSMELNLQMKLHVGKFSGSYNPNAGITADFNGAIQRIIESGNVIDSLVGGALKVVNITEYRGPPCYTSSGGSVCVNGGKCTAELNEFDCLCIPPFTGKTCASSSSSGTINQDGPVSFDGYTYYSYFNAISKKEGSQKKNRYTLQFSTNAKSGLLLIQSKGASVRDDYLAIAVVDGVVEAGYNLGKQSPNNLFTIRSDVYVSDGEWHSVVFTRDLVNAQLFVDEEETITGSSVAGTNDLNTDGMLWIGGKPEPPTGLPQAYQIGFQGCIKSVQIDTKTLNLVNDRKNIEIPVAFCD